MIITPEYVTAEINYRLERAQAAALRDQARKARKTRGWRLFAPRPRPPARQVRPALP